MKAYIGQDIGFYAARRITLCTKPMFGRAGYSYVYFFLNIVTLKEGFGLAMLVRGLQLPIHTLKGLDKLYKHLGITKDCNT